MKWGFQSDAELISFYACVFELTGRFSGVDIKEKKRLINGFEKMPLPFYAQGKPSRFGVDKKGFTAIMLISAWRFVNVAKSMLRVDMVVFDGLVGGAPSKKSPHNTTLLSGQGRRLASHLFVGARCLFTGAYLTPIG
ncbi:hypothetical protein AB4428_06405 [Vibrio lentus]